MKIVSHTLLWLLASTLFLTWQCRKNDQITTTVSGRVYDRVTGEPIEGAFLNYDVFGPKDESSSVVIKDITAKTDINGVYSVTHKGDEVEKLYHAKTTKSGYIPLVMLGGIVQGSESKQDFGLTPKDSYIRLKINHQLASYNTIHVKCYNDAYTQQEGLKTVTLSGYWLDISIPKGSSRDTTLALPGDLSCYILWDSIKPTTVTSDIYANKDTIFLPRNGTEVYSISY